MTCEIKTYKGAKTIVLSPDDSEQDWFFAFGIAKAKLIVQHYDRIKKFVDDNTKFNYIHEKTEEQ